MKNLLLELWYKYKVRAGRKAISKISEARRALNKKQKTITESVDKYSKLHKEISKL